MHQYATSNVVQIFCDSALNSLQRLLVAFWAAKAKNQGKQADSNHDNNCVTGQHKVSASAYIDCIRLKSDSNVEKTADVSLYLFPDGICGCAFN